MKKLISLILLFAITFSAFSTMLCFNVSAEEEEKPKNLVEYQVLEKIEKLAELLDGRYFTTNGRSCWNSCCDSCMNVNVFKSKWFKVMFGNVNISQIPGHTYPDGGTGHPTGWSCHGFANFAMWYIFASDNDDVIGYKTVVKNVYFTENNIKKYAKPGDVIRYYNGGSGHSAVIVSSDEDGITVIDCNSRIGDDGYCCVRLHKIRYNGNKMAISRATNYVETPSLTLNFNANGGMISGVDAQDLKYTVNSDGLICNAQTGAASFQKFYYDKSLINVVNDDYFSLIKEESEFLGWALSPNGEVVVTNSSVLLAENIIECSDFKDKSVTLYAIWKSTHQHSYSEWLFNGNENTHSCICKCGLADIQEHNWILDESEKENERVYHCEGCGINKTVFLDSGAYSIDGVYYHFEQVEISCGWFLVNGNKIIRFNSQWR